jgi:hypothetical protein
MILGLDLWGMEEFSDDSPSLSNIKYAEFSKSIIDNISLKSSTKEKVRSENCINLMIYRQEQ